MANTPTKANSFGLCAILIWSSSFALARSVSEQIGGLTTATIICLVGGLILQGLKGKPTLPRRSHLLTGALFATYIFLIYTALSLAKDRSQMLEVALINYLWPVLTLTGTMVLFKIRPNKWVIPGTILTLIGLALVVNPAFKITTLTAHVQRNPLPYLMAFGAAITWALYSNLSRLWSQPDDKGCIEWFLFCAGLLLLGGRAFFHETATWNTHTVLELGALSILSGLSYWCWDQGVRQGNLRFITTTSYFTPVLSTLVSSVYLTVLPPAGICLGCVLLSLGALLTWKATEASPIQTQNQ